MNKEILKNISILYVEDEDNVREFTSKLLSALAKNVYTAQNGLIGLELFKENKDSIDLIVSDINMPKMNGLDMYEKIKEINEDIPIVITSAHNDPNFLKKAIEVGVNAYAMKPIDLYQLIESMIKAIEPILLKRELDQLNVSLESKAQKEIQEIKSILDGQDNIIFVTNKHQIIHVNKKFLEFFQISSIEEFSELRKDIFDFFQEEFGFITKKILLEQKCWTKYIKGLPKVDRVVKIKNFQGQEKIFAINVDKYENKDDFYVISLTDITQLKEKSNLLEYQASHDTLTGLFNRNKFKDLFGKEIRRAKRYNNSLSLILFDIDDFKAVNDNYGHQVGDEVLKEISKIVTQNVREHDSVVRWGGEEFLILLPETDSNCANVVAEKIRASIVKALISSKNLKITSSFGLSSMKDNDEEDSFIARTDDALYEAKKTGKNKIVEY